MMEADTNDRHDANRGMALWALTILFASLCYVLASGHDVFDDPFGKSIERRVYPLLVFMIIPFFGFLQAALSKSFSDGFWRMAAASTLFAIGLWEEWMTGVVFGVIELSLYALFRFVLGKTNWQARTLSHGLDRLSQNKKAIMLIWVTIPLINLAAAIFLHPILTELYSSGGGSDDSIRLYSIRPSLIRRVDMLSWNGLIIFTANSITALFIMFRKRKTPASNESM